MSQLSNEELTVLIQQGRAELLSDLWEQTKALLFRLLRKYSAEYDYEARGYTLEDLEQECFIILCEAVKSFDVEKELKLSTYFNYCIKNHLNTIIGNRIKSLGLDLLNGAESLNKPITTEDETFTLEDTIADNTNNFESVDNMIFNAELHNSLEIALNDLESIERECIRLHFYKEQNTANMSVLLNMSKGRVNQKIHKGLKTLRRNKELNKYKAEIMSARSYNHIGLNAFFHKGSIEEILVEQFETPSTSKDNAIGKTENKGANKN